MLDRFLHCTVHSW